MRLALPASTVSPGFIHAARLTSLDELSRSREARSSGEPDGVTANLTGPCRIRPATSADRPGAYRVCLETGNDGADGTCPYAADPDALGRIYVGPYLLFEPELSLVLEDDDGICGYALGALDSRRFYDRYDREWRPRLCAEFPEPGGDRQSTGLRLRKSIVNTIIRDISARNHTSVSRRTCTSTCSRVRRAGATGAA